jgi:hypothetical protein
MPQQFVGAQAGHRLLKMLVLFFQLPKATQLRYTQALVLFLPVIVGQPLLRPSPTKVLPVAAWRNANTGCASVSLSLYLLIPRVLGYDKCQGFSTRPWPGLVAGQYRISDKGNVHLNYQFRGRSTDG